ncbi:MAG: S-layer homology domain-containing protein, partial [Peptococcaceae bacterium]|nr:S-layer homology domain-containing protein [Peptococcaceae bacterium]
MKHLQRKACSLLCIIVLLTSLLPASAWAVDSTIEPWTPPSAPTDVSGSWTEANNYDTSWYNETDKTFTLNDAADLAGLAVIVNGLNGHAKDNFAGKTITLAADTTFDLSTHLWTPIGNPSNVDEYFKGAFDGNSENRTTITGMTILNASGYNGLFAFVNSATIKNAKLTDGYISLSSNRYTRVGGIVCHVTGTTTITNCSFDGTIDASDGSSEKYNNIGGIVGETDSEVTIENCRTNGKIFGNGYYMGGIVGYSYASSAGIDVTITDCINEAELRPATCTAVGGIVGISEITGNLTVSACVNNEDITPTVYATNLGGIVGRINGAASAAITGCKNTAALTSGNSENMGGIVGYSNQSTTITDCHNSGTVTNSSVGEYPELTYTGGILGRMETKDLSVKQCSNQGAVSGSDKYDAYVGGLIGGITSVGTLEKCYNAGACRVTSAQYNAFVGGLVGDSSTLTLQNSYNVGKISNDASSSDSYIGGLIGRAENSSIKTSYNAGEMVKKNDNDTIGAIVGSADTNSSVTDCYYWSGCGAQGAGTGRTANDMTENDTWMTNLSGFSADIWEKAANDPETTGNLPVLTNNEQEPAPTLTREAKQTQTGFAITGQPSDPIYETQEPFTLTASGGQSKGAVTWSTSDENIASVDQNGTVTIEGVGPVTITAAKAGDDTYADAIATYSFSVLGMPISEVTISNLKAPVSGEDPVTYVEVPEDANYHGLVAADLGDSTATVEWYDNEGNRVHKGDNFMQNEVYTVVVPLAANDYYSFAEEIQVNTPVFTPGTVTMVSTAPDPNLENTIRVSITFKPTTHEHNYDYGNWTTDPLHHWHACTENDCPLMPSEMPDYAAHTGNPGEACSVCGAVIGYEITFDANGGQCDTTSMYTDTTGKLSALPTPTRGGYTFDGWFTEQSGGTAVTTETVYDKNTTLYAHWTAIPSGSSSYMIDVIESTHGTVTASPKWASSGRIVTLTVTPDEGYELAALTVTDKNGNDVALTNNGDGTYTFKMPTSKVTVKATFTKDLVTLPFIDVHPDDWFYDPVCYVYSQGLMTGTSATTFEPNTSLSRAMLVAVLHRLEGSPQASAGDFTDVADGDWYAQAVNWAASVGVVNGFDDGTFQPNAAITREQMAAILRNYAAYKGMDVTAV